MRGVTVVCPSSYSGGTKTCDGDGFVKSFKHEEEAHDGAVHSIATKISSKNTAIRSALAAWPLHSSAEAGKEEQDALLAVTACFG